MPAAVRLDQLIDETNAFVDPWRIPDLAPTGLQVRADTGSQSADGVVRRVALAVSATTPAIDAAAEWGADVLVTHHGMYWGTTRPSYNPVTDPARRWDEARAARLRAHGISLAAWHLPLDAHREVGNNAELARGLGLRVTAAGIGSWPGTEAWLGVRAEADHPLSAADLGRRAARLTGAEPVVVPGRPEGIRTVGIVSGGGGRSLYEAIDLGLDAFVTGEGELWAYDLAFDAGVTFIALGHHRSERLGVIALGAWMARRYGVKTRFFDDDNPF